MLYHPTYSSPARYDRDASRYHQGVYKRKRTDLTATLDATLSPLFLGQLKNAHRLCLNSFKKELLDSLKGDDYSFADVVKKAQTSWETSFLETAKEAVVEEEGSQWVWEDEMDMLKEEMTHVADQCRRDETKKMVNLIEVSMSAILMLACPDCFPAQLQEADHRASRAGFEYTVARHVGPYSQVVQVHAQQG